MENKKRRERKMDHDSICELRGKMQGKRMTKQRAIIFDILKQNRGRHYHVSDLYQLVKKNDPAINLSTLYRTLNEFKKANIVDELHLEEEHHHYEMKDKGEHQHLICEKCSSVVEFELPSSAKKMTTALAKKYGFSAKNIRMHITGLCKRCQK